MSWILKFIARCKRDKLLSLSLLIIVVLLIVSCVCLFMKAYVWIVICLVVGISFVLNYCTVRKIYRQQAEFRPTGTLRNVNTLYIGDLEPSTIHPAVDPVLKLCAPYRTYEASFEILRRTSSILNEEGSRVYLLYRKQKKKKDLFSVFDIPILSMASWSIKAFHLEKIKFLSQFPLFCSPLKSLLLIVNKKAKYQQIPCTDEALLSFCKERNIQVFLLEQCQ